MILFSSHTKLILLELIILELNKLLIKVLFLKNNASWNFMMRKASSTDK